MVLFGIYSHKKRLRVVSPSEIIAVVLIVVLAHFPPLLAQRNSAGRSSPSSYKDQLLIYPTGIRSERDLPVCPNWIADEDEANKDEGPSPSFSPYNSASSSNNDPNKLQQPTSTKNPFDPSSKKSDTPSKFLAACNIVHKRYFKPPMIERLCRCADRTECPMEWSQPPLYKDLLPSKEKKGSMRSAVSTTPSTKPANLLDPFTVMISSRTQLKFCTEVAGNLPICDKSSHANTKNNKDKESTAEEIPSMIKTVKKTFITPELTSVSVNCYCPPLYRGWTFLSKKEPANQGNETSEINSLYRCDKLRRCKFGQQCGNVRTDYHFSYYHCACPKNNLCVPKVYPPISTDDVIEHAEEALYSGEVAPAFCTPT